MGIKKFTANVTALVADWDRLIDEFFKSIEPDLIDANTAQLDDGIDSKGDQLPPYANPDYARLKGRSIPDLKLTGDFWESFFIDQTKQSIKIDAKDSKRNKLVDKYGIDIFGLTDKNIDQLIKDQILPDFMLFLRKRIFAK